MRLTIGVLLAVVFSPLAQADLIDEINDRGELRIVVPGNAAPDPAALNAESKPLTGFDVELGQALARELGVRAEFIEAPATDLVPGVEEGKFDITVAAPDTGATENLDSSQPFDNQKRVIQFQKGNPAFESALNNALQRIKDSGDLKKLEANSLNGAQQTAEGQ